MFTLTPRLKAIFLIVGLTAGSATVFGAMRVFNPPPEGPQSGPTNVAAINAEQSVPGEAAAPNYKIVQEQADRWAVETAQESGGSAIATLRELEAQAEPEETVTPSPPPQPAPAAEETVERTPPAPVQQPPGATNPYDNSDRVGQKVAALEALLRGIQPRAHAQTEIEAEEESGPQVAAAQTGGRDEAGQPTALPIPAAQIYYGMMITGVNSDEPGPVLAEIVSGPFKGARLLGTLERVEQRVILRFSQFSFLDETTGVDAYAIDGQTARTALATDVDNRTFSRWAAVIGSALLTGAQRAVLADGDVVVTGFGTAVSERNIGPADVAIIALGEIGNRTAPLAEEYFRRPPTVTVASGTPIGVLFAAPAEIPIPAGYRLDEADPLSATPTITRAD